MPKNLFPVKTNEISKMERSREEAEVIICLDFAEELASISVGDWPAQARKFQKFFGEPLKITRQTVLRSDNGPDRKIDRVRSAFWKVPLTNLSIRLKRRGNVRQSSLKVA